MPESGNNWALRLENKIDNLADKVDGMNDKMYEQHSEAREYLHTRMKEMDERINNASQKLADHEKNFGLLNFLVTSGLASILGLVSFFSGWFNPPKH